MRPEAKLWPKRKPPETWSGVAVPGLMMAALLVAMVCAGKRSSPDRAFPDGPRKAVAAACGRLLDLYPSMLIDRSKGIGLLPYAEYAADADRPALRACAALCGPGPLGSMGPVHSGPPCDGPNVVDSAGRAPARTVH